MSEVIYVVRDGKVIEVPFESCYEPDENGKFMTFKVDAFEFKDEAEWALQYLLTECSDPHCNSPI